MFDCQAFLIRKHIPTKVHLYNYVENNSKPKQKIVLLYKNKIFTITRYSSETRFGKTHPGMIYDNKVNLIPSQRCMKLWFARRGAVLFVFHVIFIHILSIYLSQCNNQLHKGSNCKMADNSLGLTIDGISRNRLCCIIFYVYLTIVREYRIENMFWSIVRRQLAS